MQHSSSLFGLIFMIASLHFAGIYAIIQKVVRTDNAGSCITTLLKYLPLESFSASSVLKNDPNFGPDAAVMDMVYEVKKNNRAWCPGGEVSNKSTEWLQIEFNSMKIIANIFTHGRDGGNYGEFVPNYYLDYQREDGMTWYRYRDGDRGELIKGNNDARNPAQKNFESPLIVKRIRIIPFSSSPRSVCLRITLYGCDFSDGVVEYRIPRGDSIPLGSGTHSFDDNEYDGMQSSNETWLTHGIGKLMNNVVPSNLSNENDTRKFFVVWDRKIKKSDHIDILFRFDTVRKFRAISLYPAVVPSLLIEPPESVQIQMSISESDTNPNSLTVKIPRFLSDRNRPRRINLHDDSANLVRMTIFFGSRRMGFSEIWFESEPVGVATLVTRPITHIKYSTNSLPNTVQEPQSTELSSQIIIPVTLIACFVSALIVVSGITVVSFLLVRCRKQRRRKEKLCDYRSIVMKDPVYPPSIGDLEGISGKSSVYYGPVLGSNSSGTIGIRYIHPSYPQCQEYRAHSNSNSNDYEPIDPHWMNQSLKNGSLRKDKPIDILDQQRLLVASSSELLHTPGLINIGQRPPFRCSDLAYQMNLCDPSQLAQEVILQTYPTQGSFTSIFNIHVENPLKGLIGSTSCFDQIKTVPETWLESALSRLSAISANNITTQSHISQGDIGSINSGLVEDYNVGIVIAVMHAGQVNRNTRNAFYRQCLMTIKQDFSSHPNMLPIIGMSGADNLCARSIIYAYPSHINVVTFFHKLRQLPKSNDVTFTCNYVSHSSLLYMVKQLSDALAFLHESSVIHRDVSARNCSIGDRFHLILSDFAIGLKEFEEDYTPFFPGQLDGVDSSISVPKPVLLPLLWMPWEAIIMGNYSSKSDVWSFGVTLWELFTECQLKPYSMVLPISTSNSNIVVQNTLLLATSHPSSTLPNGRTIDQTNFLYDRNACTDIGKAVKAIMNICWQPNPTLRPSCLTLYSLISDIVPDLKCADEYGTLYRLIS